MTDRAQPHHGVPPRPLTQRFPHPGRRVEQAYRELDIALYGSDEEKKALGSPRALLLADQARLRGVVGADRRRAVSAEARAAAALVEARRRGLTRDHEDILS